VSNDAALRSLGLPLGWLAALFLAACAGCNSTPAHEGGVATSYGDPTHASDEIDMLSDNDENGDQGIIVYGMRPGGEYEASLRTAEEYLELEPRGPAVHSGNGAIDGMRATAELRAHDGRLSGLILKLHPAEPDDGIEGARPLKRLINELGEPTERSGSIVRWARAGFEVTLQRIPSHPRGAGGGEVSYTVRAKPL
jgi:hypothetical protein